VVQRLIKPERPIQIERQLIPGGRRTIAAQLFGASVRRCHPRFLIKAAAQDIDRFRQLLCADRRGRANGHPRA
jgi:hypothetical protein